MLKKVGEGKKDMLYERGKEVVGSDWVWKDTRRRGMEANQQNQILFENSLIKHSIYMLIMY